MPTLLHIDSSPRPASVSGRLAGRFAEEWRRQNPAGHVIYHHTSRERIPYLDEEMVEAYSTPAGSLTEKQRGVLAYSDSLVDELLAADVVVLGAPMWNLGVPASLKAWIDMVVREGRTFAFTPQGVQGLLSPDTKIYVFSACGGVYPEESPAKTLDLLEPYLRAILGAIGLIDVTFIRAESQSSSPEAAAEGLAQAEAALAELFA